MSWAGWNISLGLYPTFKNSTCIACPALERNEETSVKATICRTLPTGRIGKRRVLTEVAAVHQLSLGSYPSLIKFDASGKTGRLPIFDVAIFRMKRFSLEEVDLTTAQSQSSGSPIS